MATTELADNNSERLCNPLILDQLKLSSINVTRSGPVPIARTNLTASGRVSLDPDVNSIFVVHAVNEAQKQMLFKNDTSI